jgi:hypothetical protein
MCVIVNCWVLVNVVTAGSWEAKEVRPQNAQYSPTSHSYFLAKNEYTSFSASMNPKIVDALVLTLQREPFHRISF